MVLIMPPAAQYVENGPPTEIADRFNASMPHYLVRLVQARVADRIANTVDKYIPIFDETKAVRLDLLNTENCAKV